MSHIVHWALLIWIGLIPVRLAAQERPEGVGSFLHAVVRPSTPAEQALLASLQGLVNRDRARLWIDDGGMNGLIFSELRAWGVEIRWLESVWDALDHFRADVAGGILCSAADESLNVATSLAGLEGAVVVDASLSDRFRGFGRPVLEDVRSLTEAALFERDGHRFTRGIALHQDPAKPLHARDLAVARGAFTFFEPGAERRTRWVAALGPGTRVFGWGRDEHEFVGDVSAGGGVVIPSDWSLNLSALQHLKVPLAGPDPVPEPPPARDGERVVAFVVSDGDNIQWMGGRFAVHEGFWASPFRGTFAVTWETAPILAEVAPRAVAHLRRNATPRDAFIAGPSGHGYWFPHRSPARTELYAATARSLPSAGLRWVSVLNSGGGPGEVADLLAHAEVGGVVYKDYAPYNRRRGEIAWHHGKACVAYRFLLWEQRRSDGTVRPDWLPEGVAAAVGEMPAAADRDPGAFALVNVHAWSFRDSGGPMGAIRRTIDRLPPGTRVVTVPEFFVLLGPLAPGRGNPGSGP